MVAAVAEQRVDHRHALEIVPDGIFHRHADAAMELDRVLADKPSATPDLGLRSMHRPAAFLCVVAVGHHRRVQRD